MKKLLPLLFLAFSTLFTGNAQTVKGLYVDGFSTIIGNTTAEDSLLSYAQYNSFNYLALYDLWTVHTAYNLTNASTCTVLANFIQRAKQSYGITEVGAIGENFFFFNNVINIYNQQHSNPLQKFDVYNVEFEFWTVATVSTGGYYCTTYLQPGGYTCDTAGAFSFYKRLLHQVDSLANITGVISETYVGWFNQGQAITIGNTVDRILLHDYINNYSALYSYIQPRLQLIAARNVVTKVIPIFSAEPSFMGPWLSTHTVYLPFADLQTDLTNETGTWKNYINLQGYQWFAYSFMPYSAVSTGHLSLPDTEIKLFPNPSTSTITIETKYQLQSIKIFNLLGEAVTVAIPDNNQSMINISQLSQGIYFAEILTDKGAVRKKIVKE